MKIRTTAALAHAVTFALGIAWLGPAGASAQERPLTVARTLPTIPAIDARMVRRVEGFERLARRSLTCVLYEGEREGDSYSDERCWDWYDRLGSSGDVGVHAMGRVVLSELEAEAEPGEAHVRLVELIGASSRPLAAPYLMHILSASDGERIADVGIAVAAIDGLNTTCQVDVAPIAPWVNRFDVFQSIAARGAVLDGWLAWYGGHKDDSRTEWRRQGLESAEGLLHASDPVQRFAAIARLRGARRAHRALQESVREMLAQPELTADARRYVARYAGRHGLLSRDEVRAALRS
ncbi:MAG: hypothetical protein AB7S26_27880 [Sandaracinaceae bacterium]